MLYVYLDGRPTPSLWAELDADDLGLPGGVDTPLSAGFTGSSPVSDEAITIEIDSWALHETAVSAVSSRLIEEGDVVGAAEEPAHVHIDARDSCKLPRVSGADGVRWSATITDPHGAAVTVEAIQDLGDGTHRISFTPMVGGLHRFIGASALSGSFHGTFVIAARRE
jgi:hypothetical protein